MRHFKPIDWSVSLSLLLACVLSVIAACVDSSGPLGAPNVITETQAVSTVKITLAQPTLAPGQTTQATVVSTSADGKIVNGRVDYSSQNPSVATVSPSGRVTAVAVGLAAIQATVSGRGATASLTVQSQTSAAAPIAAVAVAFDSTKIVVGHTAQASAVVKDTAGNTITGQTVTWSSLTPTVATVSSSGAVTAIAAGTASIKATVSSVSGDGSLTVEPLRVATVTVTIDSASLSVGNTGQAFATAKDSVGNIINGQTVMWTSLSPTIASVSSSGKITALAVGVAVIQATVAGCSGSTDLAIQSQSNSVAIAVSVSVAVDSTTLQVGHVARAVVTAKDASGNTITNPTVTWTSLNNAATVSSGTVTGAAEGMAQIQASVSGIAATDSVLVVVAADLASQNFDGGSVSPYVNFWDPAAGGNGDVDVISDPTGAGKGKVARMHYVGTNQDRNRFLEYDHHIGFGSTIYSRGDFYFDVADLGDGYIARKLIYYLPHEDYLKYNGNNLPTFFAIVGPQGNSLYVTSGYVPADGSAEVQTSVRTNTVLLPKTWYTLETQITPETSIGAGNGIFRVWLDGALIYEKTNVQWTDPAWVGQLIGGTPLDLADIYFERVEVGEQVNYNIGSFDEYRYWDRVAFSTKRIGN